MGVHVTSLGGRRREWHVPVPLFLEKIPAPPAYALKLVNQSLQLALYRSPSKVDGQVCNMQAALTGASITTK